MGQVAKLKRTWNLASSPPNCSKDYWKLLYLLISINWPSLVTSWYVVQEIYSKMHLVSCTNTDRDVTDLVNHGMVKNTKSWISWEWNIIFVRNKKIPNLCFRWHVLRGYRFVAEVTFKLGVMADHTPSKFLKAVFLKADNFYSVHSWIFCPIWKYLWSFDVWLKPAYSENALSQY